MHQQVVLTLICLLCLGAASHAAPARPDVSGFFPTGVWFFWEDDASYINRHVDDAGKARAYYETTMRDLGTHGVNLIIANWTPRDHRGMLLDAAEKNGVKIVVHLDEINSIIGGSQPIDTPAVAETLRKAIAPIKDHPALVGYYLIDEPANNPNVAARIAAAKRLLEKIDPRRPGFSCLLGAYEDLLKTVDYRVLLIDIYPIGMAWTGDFSGYISELERGRRNAGDRPLWVIPQAFGKENAWRIPTPAEIRAQVWLALASGAKGIVYFIYQSTTGYQGEWLKGLADMQLKPMDGRWAEVGRINADIKSLAPTLLRLKPSPDKLAFPATVLANTFADPDGARYVIIANRSATKSVYVAWPHAPATDVLTHAKVTSGTSLQPGAGKLLKME